MRKENSFAKNTAILFAAMVVTKIIGAILKIPLTNILGGVGMGYYSTAFSIFTPVYASLSAGIPTVITTLVAQNASRHCYQNIRQLKRCALIISSLSGALGSIVVFTCAGVFSGTLASSPNSMYAVMAIAPSVLFCCIAAAFKGYFEGLSNMLPTAISQVVEAAVKAIFGLSLSYAVIMIGTSKGVSYEELIPYSAAAAIAGISFGELCGTVFLAFYNKRKSDGITDLDVKCSPNPPKVMKTTRSVIFSALPISLGAAAGSLGALIDMMTVPSGLTIAAQKIPQYFISKYNVESFDEFGTMVYGSYTGIVLTLFMLITGVTALMGKSALPKISAQRSCSNKKNLIGKVESLFSGIFAIGLPMCIGLAVFSKEILAFLYPTRKLEVALSVEPLIIISGAGIFIAFTGGLFIVFQALGMNHIPVNLTLCSVALKYVFNLTFTGIPEAAVIAAAASTSISHIVICIIGYVILIKKVKLKPRLIGILIKPLISSALATAGGYTVMKLFSEYSLTVSLLSGCLSFGIIYLLLMALLYKDKAAYLLKRLRNVALFSKG